MAIVRTVLGEIPAEELGYTSVHEHTIADLRKLMFVMLRSVPDMMNGAKAYQNGADTDAEQQRRKELGLDNFPVATLDGALNGMKKPKDAPSAKLSDMEYFTNELKAYYDFGGRAICDCSPALSFKGKLSVLQELSRRSKVHIVANVGYYTRPSIAKRLWKKGPDALRREIDLYMQKGDGSCDARPGFVKCAISALENGELSQAEWTSIQACASAAKDYGMSLHIHTAFPVRRVHIRKVADYMEQELHLEPERVLFCHMDSYNLGPGNPAAQIGEKGYDLSFPAELAKRGFHIGLDTWSLGKCSDEERKFQLGARENLLLELIALGCIDQITLGHDMMNRNSGVQMGCLGYTQFPHCLAQMVQDGRLTEEQVNILTVRNPAKLLAIKQ